MPWLPIYADKDDFIGILDWLNSSDEVAFVVPDGPRRWRAITKLDCLSVPRICIWHVPSGPLPLVRPYPDRTVTLIESPQDGWEELRTGADPNTPFFGVGHPGIIWLNHRPVSLRTAGGIGLSSYEWIGNHYRMIGNAAEPVTEAYWKLLRKWTQKQSKKIPRSGALDGAGAEIFAFPSAFREFQSGTPRDDNP